MRDSGKAQNEEMAGIDTRGKSIICHITLCQKNVWETSHRPQFNDWVVMASEGHNECLLPPAPGTTSPERRLFCSTPPAAASGLANKLRVSRKWHGRWRQARTEMKLGTTNFISKTFFLNSFNKKQPLDVKKAPNAHHKGRVQIKGKKTPTKFPFQKNQAFCFVCYPTWPRSGTGSMGTRTVCGGVDPGFFSR